MNWKSLVNFSGLNYWLLASGIGLNLIFTFIIIFLSFDSLTTNPQAPELIQIGLMVAIFFSTFLTGWLLGRMADDNRGPTYGLIGSLGSVGLIIPLLLPAGILGFLLAVVALAGGLNGGIMSLPRKKDQR
jgi:hypothetical protein